MNAAAARLRLYAAARALDEAAGPALSPRARRLARRLSATPVAFADLLQAPDWAGWPEVRRRRLARLAAAAGAASAWRRSLDGRMLRRAAEAVGEPVLDALLTLSPSLTPRCADAASEAADTQALDRKGGAILTAAARLRPGFSARLAELFGAEVKDQPEAGLAMTLRRTALSLLARAEAAGAAEKPEIKP